MTDHVLFWDGIVFRPRPVSSLTFNLPRVRFIGAALDSLQLLASDQDAFARAMAINSAITAVIATSVQVQTGETWKDKYNLGLAFPGGNVRRNLIYVKLNQPNRMLSVIYHELFHTIYANFPENEVAILEAYGNLIRSENDQKPRFNSEWLAGSEEAEAAAFELFSMGEPQPFGLTLPRPVERIFRRVQAGRYSHHAVAAAPAPGSFRRPHPSLLPAPVLAEIHAAIEVVAMDSLEAADILGELHAHMVDGRAPALSEAFATAAASKTLEVLETEVAIEIAYCIDKIAAVAARVRGELLYDYWLDEM